jgi:hypothetical protein
MAEVGRTDHERVQALVRDMIRMTIGYNEGEVIAAAIAVLALETVRLQQDTNGDLDGIKRTLWEAYGHQDGFHSLQVQKDSSLDATRRFEAFAKHMEDEVRGLRNIVAVLVEELRCLCINRGPEPLPTARASCLREWWRSGLTARRKR